MRRFWSEAASSGRPTHRSEGRHARANGFALPVVLLLISAMSVVALRLVDQSRGAAMVSDAWAAELAARHAADGGIDAAMALSERGETLPIDAPLTLRIGEATVAVRAVPETGKVDLNIGPLVLIEGVMLAAGLDETTARSLVRQVADERAAEPPRVFHAVDELLRLDGMEIGTLERVRPALTVYGASPGINSGLAPKLVLMAVPGMSGRLANETLAARAIGAPAPAETRALLGRFEVAGRPVFTLRAEARRGDGARFVREAVVDFSAPGEPLVLDWRQGLGEAGGRDAW